MCNILGFIFLFISIAVFGQDGTLDYSAIDKRDLKQYIKVLTSDSLHGRQTGSSGQKMAAQFIATQFERLGLKAGGNDQFFQKFEVALTFWSEVYINVNGRTLNNFQNMAYLGHRVQLEEDETEVVFGGNGTPTQLDQVTVNDKMVLIFSENMRASYEISERLRERKALGYILANPTNEKQFASMSNTFRDYLLQKRFQLMPDEITHDSKEYLAQFIIPNSEIRNLMGQSKNALQKFINNNDLKSCPVAKVKWKSARITQSIETENVVGVLKGTSNRAIVVSAHYDTYTPEESTVRDFRPGADDNATGVAAMLELAEEFAGAGKLSHDIIFVATTGEENGLLGSRYYADHLNPDSVWCNLNVDMIGRVDAQHKSNVHYLYSVSGEWKDELHAAIQQADAASGDCHFDFTYYNTKDPSGYFNRGDHYSFYQKGISSIMFFSGVHADYHKPADTANKIQYELLEQRVLLIGKVIAALQQTQLR